MSFCYFLLIVFFCFMFFFPWCRKRLSKGSGINLRTFKNPFLDARIPVVFEQQWPVDPFHSEGLGTCRVIIRGIQRAFTKNSFSRLADLFSVFPMPVGWHHLASLENHKTWTGQDCFKYVSLSRFCFFLLCFVNLLKFERVRSVRD
jgi:hypothetical protein